MSEEPEYEEVTFQRFCTELLNYELSPWQNSWAYRINRGDERIGFNFRPSDGQAALDLMAMAMLWRGILHGQVSYVLCNGRAMGREFNSIALSLVNRSPRLSRMVEVHTQHDFFKCRDAVFSIVVDKRSPLPSVEGGWDVIILESNAVPGDRQLDVIAKADRIFYPNLSPKAACASRPKSRARS